MELFCASFVIFKFVLMNEIGEAATVLLDTKVISMLDKFEDVIDYIHVSDQFSGPKIPEYVIEFVVSGHF